MRSSWLIARRNSVLALLACSAIIRASPASLRAAAAAMRKPHAVQRLRAIARDRVGKMPVQERELAADRRIRTQERRRLRD